jgi:hypothetical protein
VLIGLIDSDLVRDSGGEQSGIEDDDEALIRNGKWQSGRKRVKIFHRTTCKAGNVRGGESRKHFSGKKRGKAGKHGKSWEMEGWNSGKMECVTEVDGKASKRDYPRLAAISRGQVRLPAVDIASHRSRPKG